MINYFLFGILLLGAAALFVRWFAYTDPSHMARAIKGGLAGLLLLLVLYLALTGRLAAAFGGLAGIVGLLLRWGEVWFRLRRILGMARGTASGASGASGTSGNTAGGTSNAMSRAEALDILGLTETAGEREIKAAHHRLMAKIHPDQGGSEGLAKRLNQARDILLKG